MAKSITIRDVPIDVISVLAERAAATARSLQEYLRDQLVLLTSNPDAEAWAAQVRARAGRTGSRLPLKEILAHRKADRR